MSLKGVSRHPPASGLAKRRGSLIDIDQSTLSKPESNLLRQPDKQRFETFVKSM